MPRNKYRLVTVAGAALLASALIVPSASAQLAADSSTDTTVVSVVGGLLSMTDVAVGDFDPAAVTGIAQTVDANASSDFEVSDFRGGTGFVGWNLTVEATPFVEAVPASCLVSCLPLVGGATLAAGSLTQDAPAVTKVDTNNLSAAPSSPTGSLTLDSGSVTLASADAGEATGAWDFTQTDAMTLALPADVEPAEYFSTITYTLNSGP